MYSIKRFVSLVILLLFCAGFIMGQDKFVVVLDPGHGGKDGGAVRGVYKEKDINLAVALILGDLIEQNFKDVKVVYTRKKDIFIDLDKRADIANKAKANLFISIHTNSTAAKTTKTSGADTYILGLAKSAENLEVAKRENSVILLEDDYSTKYEGFDPTSPESYIIFEFISNKYMEQSLKFAEFLQTDFKDVARRSDRGVRQAGFLVLRKTSMPSVLIELGFINNQAEAKFLSSRLGQRSMATAIYSGFKKYKLDYDRRRGQFNYVEKDNSEVKEAPKVAVTQASSKTEKKADIKQEEKKQLPQTAKQSQPVVEKKVEPKIVEVVEADLIINDSEAQKKERPKSIPVVKVVTEPKKEEAIKTELKEQPKVQQPKVEPKPEVKKSFSPDQIVYKVQFYVTSTVLVENSPTFKGLSPVAYYEDDGAVKYTYGETADYNEIIKIQRQVKAKFSDAFVVKFKNGKRIK